MNSSIVHAEEFKQSLNAKWHYYDQQLLQTADSKQSAEKVSLPIEFEEIVGHTSTYGTFVQTFEIPQSYVNQQLGIEIPYMYSASKIFVNGVELGEVGKVGTTETEHKTDLQSVILPFISPTKEVEVAIQVSSFQHIRGGFSDLPTIGDWESIQRTYNSERYVTIFIATIIFVVGLSTLAIGIMDRNQKLLLTFGIFAIVVAIRSIFAVPFIYHELPIPISYELATRFEYITTTLCFSLYAIFIYILYNKLFAQWMLYLNVGILTVLGILAVFTSPQFFQTMFFNVFPFMLLFVIYNIWIMYKALRFKLQLAKSLLLGVLFVLTGLVVDFLSGMGILYSPSLANFMIALNVLLVLLAVCRDYVKQIHAVTQLNSKLDELVQKRTFQLHSINEELKLLVNLDALTGIYNRHKFNEVIYKQFDYAKKENQYLSLMMLDLDEFKKYNDYYGHVCGDDLLVHIVKFIQEILLENVTFARYGGEEFVIILPNYALENTRELAEVIRQTIEQEKIEHLGRVEKIVTVSIGCAEYREDEIDTVKQLIELADTRLYISKEVGRNTVTIKNELHAK